MESDPLALGYRRVHARPFAVYGHDPLLRLSMPQQPGVSSAVLDDGIALELGPGGALVLRVRDAFTAARAGKGDDHRRPTIFCPPRSILMIDHPAAGERKVILSARIEGNRQFLPVHEIGAHRMAPMHAS